MEVGGGAGTGVSVKGGAVFGHGVFDVEAVGGAKGVEITTFPAVVGIGAGGGEFPIFGADAIWGVGTIGADASTRA